jgi:HlyD family secretion protein
VHLSKPILMACIVTVGLAFGNLGHPAAAEQPNGLAAMLQQLWQKLGGKRLPDGIAAANGRIEADEVLVSAKLAGRVADVLVSEGDTVEAGAVLARMDTSELDAELAGAKAEVRRAETAIARAKAAITQRESELTLAKQEFERASTLKDKGFGTEQSADLKRSTLNVAQAALNAAKASLDETEAAADVARAEVARIASFLDDSVLKAPRRGRIEYKLVPAGEVVAAGAPILTLLDLSSVYMTVFVPASVAGHLQIGGEARIVLDPAPDYVVPATVSFVAGSAQFTPKTVETDDERQKLMFRVKLTIAPSLLRQYETYVKSGVRGVAYMRTDPDLPWPGELDVKLPR